VLCKDFLTWAREAVECLVVVLKPLSSSAWSAALHLCDAPDSCGLLFVQCKDLDEGLQGVSCLPVEVVEQSKMAVGH
jgi:hypothetical protein